MCRLCIGVRANNAHDVLVSTRRCFVLISRFFFLLVDPPGDPGKKSSSSVHFRLCTVFVHLQNADLVLTGWSEIPVQCNW